MTSDDGINMSAFPRPDVRDANGCGIREGSDGMMLRDWFAGQALPTAIQMAGANTRLMGLSDQELSMWAARIAYGAADAMLAARQESAA